MSARLVAVVVVVVVSHCNCVMSYVTHLLKYLSDTIVYLDEFLFL